MKTDLSVRIGKLTLKNPVLTASGTFGYGTEYQSFFNIDALGGIITKTVTLEPRAGNPCPRIAETPAGMLNSIGLSNVGIDRYITEKLPLLEPFDTVVIANIAGKTIDDYAEVVRRLEPCFRVDGIEVNISCPNVERGGLAFGTDPEVTGKIVHRLREETDKTLIIKLTPNVTDITAIARAAVENGADALSLINTVLGMAVDVRTRKPLIKRVVAGLSGPAIKPIALAKLYQTAQAVSVPLIGLGGIMTGEDAMEFIITGATAIQTGTLHFVDPAGPIHVLEGITEYCRQNKIAAIRDCVGTLITK